ncbi:MAG: SUMF1/EgtB/PvdO family nonheme iron enzyme [Alphaproteobacteria bacterium]|nr:SUMF1/EgtB/PvdO family nonheme iron enzyme [Alphaproteobacteria bacterium]
MCAALALAALAVVPYAARLSAAPIDGKGGDMVAIPGASFVMGSDAGPEDERPAHRVAVAPFRLDRREVSNADFARFLNALGGFHNAAGRRLYDADDGDARIHRVAGQWRADAGFEAHPVNEASWFGARDYCAWRGARLPSEAEWERAARGPEGRRYPWGAAPPDATRARYGMGWMRTLPVGALPAGATPEGVLNLAGNVHEWTSSLYRPYPYNTSDGREDADSDAARVTRGGAADTGAATLTGTWRGRTVSRGPRAGHHNIGFRCAKAAR